MLERFLYAVVAFGIIVAGLVAFNDKPVTVEPSPVIDTVVSTPIPVVEPTEPPAPVPTVEPEAPVEIAEVTPEPEYTEQYVEAVYEEPAQVESYGSADAWASGSKQQSVIQCESGGNYSTNTGNGYYGAWQFDRQSWLANGGGEYAALPHQASPSEQNQVAYNYYQQSGWSPWACA